MGIHQVLCTYLVQQLSEFYVRCSPLSQEFCDVLADEELYYFFPKKKSNHSTCHRISQKKTEENFLAGNL